MADAITITIADSGNPHVDGTYPIEVPLTNRDLHSLKTIANVRMGEIEDALQKGDNDVVVAFAYIGMTRNGKPVSVETLWDLPAGLIQVELPGAEEDDATPPLQRPANAEQPDAVVRPISSGADSRPSSENPDSGPSSTGTPASAIGQGYA
jgi:hypothetical protein